MLRVTFKNVLLYIFAKYMVFYIFLMFKNKNFSLIELENLKGGHSLLYFLLVMLPLPILSMILFSAPIYFSFRVRNAIYFILLMSAILITEYFLYTYLASTGDAKNGLYNIALSVLLLLVFFFNSIASVFKQSIHKTDH